MSTAKKYLFFIFFFLLLNFYRIPVNAQNLNDDFLLVQSVPLETKLEESKLPRAYDVWTYMIDNASVSIDMEMFYFANKKDSPLENLYTALKRAAGRGVKVRIIIDSSFYSRSEKSSDELEGINNITIKKIPVGNLSGGIMHAKYFVVDGEVLFLGSQNFDWRALIHIHEIGVKVKSKELANTFLKIFELDWNFCESPNDADLLAMEKSKEKFINSKNPLNIYSSYYGDVKLYPAFSLIALLRKSFPTKKRR